LISRVEKAIVSEECRHRDSGQYDSGDFSLWYNVPTAAMLIFAGVIALNAFDEAGDWRFRWR